MNRKLRMGMIGGGPGAFIGEVHRKAARMDGGIEVVAGAFHIDPALSRQMGEQLCLEPGRAYDNYQEALADYAKLIKNNPRYQGALNQGGDAVAFAKGLARGGYATDPNYAAKLSQLAGKSAS